MIKKIALFFFLFAVSLSSSQENNSDISNMNLFFDDIHALKIHATKNRIQNIQDKTLKDKLAIYYELRSINGYRQHNLRDSIDTIDIEEEASDLLKLIDLLILTEDAMLYENDRVKSFDLAHKGYKLAESLNNKTLQSQFILKILKIYKLGIVGGDPNINFYLEKLFELNKDNDLYKFKYYSDKIYLIQFGLLQGDSEEKSNHTKSVTEQSMKELDKIVEKFDKDNKLFIEYYHLKALCEFPRQDFLQSLKYFQKEEEILSKEEAVFFHKNKYENFKEIARNYSILGQFEKGKEYLRQARKYESELTPNRNDYVYNSYISGMHYGLKEKDSAYQAAIQSMQKYYLYNASDQNKIISSLEVKNKVAEKENEILEKTNWILLLFSLIVIILIFTVFYSKNSNKKRLLAIQEKELVTQRNLTLLKEQEIATINAMVEGQEKERKRVAEDLHDNLGSVIATLKLHFDNLRINRKEKKIDQETLFDRTEGLIDDAYKKVRSIAHAKNAGVIANQGFLVAVKLMAEKISSANTIQIEVVDYGLEKSIENSLEISLFRIIQELTTNIIKHARAKHATIDISQDTADITILVEDDGIGMDTSQIYLKKGMGLHSIKTRVEHLEGSFTIDSTPTKGTTIIINIPT